MKKKRVRAGTEAKYAEFMKKSSGTGVVFIRRKDLVDWSTHRNYGKFHIIDDATGEGMCFSSRNAHLVTVKTAVIERVTKQIIEDEKITISSKRVCQACVSEYIKRRNDMRIVFQENETVNVNGVMYAKMDAVAKAINELEKEHKERLTKQEGEVRTLQYVSKKEHLLTGPFSARAKTMFRTELGIKCTDIEYRAGMRVRIIIEKE